MVKIIIYVARILAWLDNNCQFLIARFSRDHCNLYLFAVVNCNIFTFLPNLLFCLKLLPYASKFYSSVPSSTAAVKTDLNGQLDLYICDMCAVFFGINHTKLSLESKSTLKRNLQFTLSTFFRFEENDAKYLIPACVTV